MIQKVKNVLGSIRFWEMLIAVVLYSLVSEGVLTNETVVGITQVIYTVLGISVGVGTVDGMFKRS